MFGWLRRLLRREPAYDVPEAERLVHDILARRGDLSWEELVAEAASVGIGEAELHEIVHGEPMPAPRAWVA